RDAKRCDLRADAQGRPHHSTDGRHEDRGRRHPHHLRQARGGCGGRASLPGRARFLLMPRLGLPSPRGTGSPMIVSGKLPAFPAILLAAAGLMLVPAAHAAQLEDWRVARTFLYHGGLLAVVAIILGIGLANYRPYRAERYQLLTLLLSYLLLPLALALPVRALTSIPFHDA